MSSLRSRVRPDWPQTLQAILSRARSVGPAGVVAFDLDSTLFDNRPRQARIVREFGRAHGLSALDACAAAHFDSGFDMKGALVNCGLSKEEAETVLPAVRGFWLERFFTSEYCVEDDAIEGAAAFLREVTETAVRIAYLTGRPATMREGTLTSIARHGFPPPDDTQVWLLMKPSPKDNDDAFKRRAHAELGTLGTVIAAFDNEPTHANDYRQRFPEATVVHLATDHSGRPVTLDPSIVSVPHFRYR